MIVAWNKKALKGLYEKSIRKIRLKGGKKSFDEYQEFEKKANEMTPNYDETETITTKRTTTTNITSEKDLPVKTIKPTTQTQPINVTAPKITINKESKENNL